jgi:hypothetical protein
MLLKECPTHTRHCAECGAEMIWLPMTDKFGQTYRWRAWCYRHGFARRYQAPLALHQRGDSK